VRGRRGLGGLLIIPRHTLALANTTGGSGGNGWTAGGGFGTPCGGCRTAGAPYGVVKEGSDAFALTRETAGEGSVNSVGVTSSGALVGLGISPSASAAPASSRGAPLPPLTVRLVPLLV